MPTPISGLPPSEGHFPQEPYSQPIERALHAFQSLYDTVGAHDVAKLTGAIRTLHHISLSAPQFEKQLSEIEERLPQLSLDTLSSFSFEVHHLAPLPSISNDEIHSALQNIFKDVLQPLATQLSEEVENETSHQLMGAIAIVKELHTSNDLEHSFKALEYDASLHEMFPSSATKEAILNGIKDCQSQL